ncbi:MAG: Fic family protein [Candidatus Ornithospirochaeta sp.]
MILDLLFDKGDMSSNEISQSLGYKTLNNTMREIIGSLIEDGKIYYLYPDKPKSRNQRLCIKK